ncbi:MAG TPA: hypothetical protein DD656_01645 [Alphaproteobacteria bacterium]|nr:hypothetical protein [Alphaproteobacteria bacterium]
MGNIKAMLLFSPNIWGCSGMVSAGAGVGATGATFCGGLVAQDAKKRAVARPARRKILVVVFAGMGTPF